ncbi:hypothetical protein GCM10027051_18760 [Niabella terrae]
MIKTSLLATLLVFSGLCVKAQYSIRSVPDPKARNAAYFVSDPKGILGADATRRLNELCAAIEQETSAEIAIVAIDDFIGNSDFDFAHELFNYWGIGKKENNNGLLLLIAKDRHRYQFVAGYGMEGILPDVTLGHIGATYLVPRFRQGDYGGGALAAIEAIGAILRDPAQAASLLVIPERRSGWQRYKYPLLAGCLLVLYVLVFQHMRRVIRRRHLKGSNTSFYIAGFLSLFLGFFGFIFLLVSLQGKGSPVFSAAALPYWIAIPGGWLLFLRYLTGRSELLSRTKDVANRVDRLLAYDRRMLPAMLMSPVCFLGKIGLIRHIRIRNRRLKPPDDSGQWKRINKDKRGALHRYLNPEQRKLEKYQSISHEIWTSKDRDQVKIIAYPGTRFKKYEDCPRCHYHGLRSKIKTLKSATYSREGLGQRMQACAVCSFEQSLGTVVLPQLVRSSASSSGASSSSWSSSSGSSSSGSWGGGSSGGGGAGGSW